MLFSIFKDKIQSYEIQFSIRSYDTKIQIRIYDTKIQFRSYDTKIISSELRIATATSVFTEYVFWKSVDWAHNTQMSSTLQEADCLLKLFKVNKQVFALTLYETETWTILLSWASA